MDARYWVRRGGIWACVLVLGPGMGPWVASARAQDTNGLFGSTSGTFMPLGARPAGGTYYVPGYPGYYFGHGFDFGRGTVSVPFNYAGSRAYPGGGYYGGYYVSPYSGGGMPPMPAGGYPSYSGGLFP